jgi:cold shock CspA family protein/ribosome-associated translation inhibitor RaiA
MVSRGLTGREKQMEPTIKAAEMPLLGDTEAYIRERAEHLARLHNGRMACRVTLEGPWAHHRTGGTYAVHIELDLDGRVLPVTKREADDAHVAIRKAFAAAGRLVRKHVEQVVERRDAPVEAGAAVVARLDRERGFGFIQAPDGREVYFHRNAVLPPGFDALDVGTRVRFAEEEGEKGPQASTVHVMRRGARKPAGGSAGGC